MLSPTNCSMNLFSLLALTLEYSLPQSWMEYNWRFCSHCPGWCSESESELKNTRVSNYPGKMFVHACPTKCLSSGNSRNTIVSVYGQNSALILEYSLPQSWKEWNWRFWSYCPGWCSESEQELDNTRVSNYPGKIFVHGCSTKSLSSGYSRNTVVNAYGLWVIFLSFC